MAKPLPQAYMFLMISALKLITEIALLALAGQWILGLLAGQRKQHNVFYQVLEMMAACGIEYQKISSSRYAKGLLRHVRTFEPAAMVDKLICGAFIEARSCERFAKLAPLLAPRIGSFYLSLLRSEARHYQDYLSLARDIAGEDLSERIAFFAAVEAELISAADSDFKFHSGAPVES